jgi:glutaminyl-tRNA synthetase
MAGMTPRMPTIAGLRRRGYTPEAIRNFAERVGVAKRESIIDVALLEFSIREDLNKHAERATAVINPLKVVITNYPEDQEEFMDFTINPEET